MVAVIAQPLGRQQTLGFAPGAIELPPVELVPASARPAMELYAADANEHSRAVLVDAIDRVGDRWEHALAVRAIAARKEFVTACQRVAAIHDELIRLHASARWVCSFPQPSWSLEPYHLYVDGRVVAVPEILGAIEDTCDVDSRLARIAGQRASTQHTIARSGTGVK
jgi:hypothetical protein